MGKNDLYLIKKLKENDIGFEKLHSFSVKLINYEESSQPEQSDQINSSLKPIFKVSKS